MSAMHGLAVILSVSLAAQQPPSEWPDPGSEESEGAKVFPSEPGEKQYDDSKGIELEAPKAVVEPVYRWSWYGWRNLIGDGAALVLLVSAVVEQDHAVELGIAGASVYGVSGPIAHLTKGNWGRALISFGMRIAGPVLLGLAFWAFSASADIDDDILPVMIGLGGFLGGFVAAGLDTGLVARHRVQVE